MKLLLTPNQVLSKKAMKMLILAEVTLAVIVWLVFPATFFPKPSEILTSLNQLWTTWDLGQNLITSFQLNIEAMGLSLVASLGMAYLSTIPVFRPLVQFAGKCRFLSMAGLSFFFTIMTKNGQELKLSILVFSVTVFFVTGMVDVVESIPKESFDLARTLRMHDWHILWEVVILGQADKAFDVLRQNAAMGYMMLTAAEAMSRSGGGIGALLETQQRYLNLSAVFAIQGLVLVLGVAQDYGIGMLKQMFCPYASLRLENK